MTEASHLLDFSTATQVDFYTWVIRGGVIAHNLETADLEKISRLCLKYRKQPMDLADGSLVILAERLRTREILTLDGDFKVYRLFGKNPFNNLLEI